MAKLRRAVDQMCRSCIFDRRAKGTWRMQVELCTCSTCPLHPVRPRSIGQISDRILEDHPRIVREMYEEACSAENPEGDSHED